MSTEGNKVIFSEEQIKGLGLFLRDEKKPLKARFRALFTLRNINTPTAREEICKSFSDPSALLKHELAYCLGQMQALDSVQILIDTLKNKEEHPMVRHECGEALGALLKKSKDCKEAYETVKMHLKDPVDEVAKTCELAVTRVDHMDKEERDVEHVSKFDSVDPAFPSKNKDVAALEKIFLNDTIPIWERYQAMFTLRDIGTPESIAILGKGLKTGCALFRHEIAFVFGQLQNPLSIDSLSESLKDLSESEMVRHECAEALGSIGTPDCERILKEFSQDPSRVVRESVEIALDICDYEMAGDFQYANGLDIITTTSVAAS